MLNMSRRSAVLAACGSLVSGALAGAAWWGRDPAADRSRPGAGGAGALTVSVLGSRRGALRAGHALHSQHALPATAAAEHLEWSDTVVADVEVHNPTQSPLLVSPGQFRIRVGGDGPTVTYYDSERAVGALAAGRTVRMWISYLVPPGSPPVSLEYAAAGATTVLSLPLTPSDQAVSS
jgi:hypothetical protein